MVMALRLFTLLLLLSSSIPAMAQLKVDGKAIPLEKGLTYLSVQGYAFNNRTNVFIDFGQWDGRFIRRQEFRSMEDEPLFFRNAIEAVNFLAEKGWEVHSSDLTTRENGFRVDYFLMKRSKKANEVLSKAPDLLRK
jgi:hypothetical protein